MTDTRTQARWGAVALVIAPAVLLAGLAYHPLIVNFTDNTAVVDAVAADATRWFIAHFTVGVGSGLLILAFLAARAHLRGAGEERWTPIALPFIVVASTLYAMLPAMEIGVLAAHAAGADALAVQNALDTWFIPTQFAAATLFAIGAIGFAVGVVKRRVLGPGLTWLVAVALVVAAAARFVPSTVALYVTGVAGVVALWPLAYAMWTHPEARAAGHARARPAA